MYEIVMTSGDRAEAETVSAALLAAKTMYDDAEGGVQVDDVNSGDVPYRVQAALRIVANQHLRETSDEVSL